MTKFDKKEFGNNIKKARKDKGLSQENLADILCVTRSAITRYENGEIFPNPEQISIICDALDIYPNDLFDSSNNKIINKENSKNPFKSIFNGSQGTFYYILYCMNILVLVFF